MARKRLGPPQEHYLAAPEVKSMGGPFAPAPIASVAGDAAASAALADLASRIEAARLGGRLVQDLPLGVIVADHLVRDRLPGPEEEMAGLAASIRARGQQVPVEVVDLGAGRYGLISGWRRLQALTALYAETGEARFATVQALLRRPETAAEAYLAMVEENEIRLGLGHYERARIAARAVEQGVYPDLRAALGHLFGNVSRAKRSKIGSFVTVYQALDGHLRFPAALPERLGLALAQGLAADPGLAARLQTALAGDPPATAAAEQARLAAVLRPAARPAGVSEPAPGIFLRVKTGAQGAQYMLSGPALPPDFAARLAGWLRQQG